jgi:DNA-binding transcriptional LysR family regulator
LVELERRPRPVQLVVRRAGGALCERLVRDAEVDLGVVRADVAPRALASRHLADDRLWFVVPAGHPLATASRPGLAEMARVPLVMFGEASRTRARVMERLAPFGASIRVEVEGRSAALAYVEAGVGATFVSLLPGHRPAARDDGRAGIRCHDVTALFGRARFFVVGRPDRFQDPLVASVVQLIRREALRRQRA